MSESTVPAIGPCCNAPQHLRALDRANVIRLRRGEIRRELAVGAITLAEAMADEACDRLAIGKLLAWQSRWGAERADRALRGICWPLRPVGGLTVRQRALIAEVVAGHLVYDVIRREHVTARERDERRAVAALANAS